MRGWRLVASVMVVLLAGAGCEIRAEVNITVEDDGSGTVEFAVGFDEEAATRGQALLAELAVGDLVSAGWQVSGPADEDDGSTWIRATRTFTSSQQLGGLIDDIAGNGGPFQDFSLERKDAFAKTEFRFSGTVDFSAGIDGLATDDDLADALNAEPIELIDAQLGGVVDDLISVRVAIRMPGDVESNALTQAANGAVWEPSVTERQEITLWATSTVTRSERLVYAGVAAAAGLALVLFISIRLMLWRRSRRS